MTLVLFEDCRVDIFAKCPSFGLSHVEFGAYVFGRNLRSDPLLFSVFLPKYCLILICPITADVYVINLIKVLTADCTLMKLLFILLLLFGMKLLCISVNVVSLIKLLFL